MTTERERFEAWLEAVRDKADPGDWLFSKREAAWKAWQAALSAPPGYALVPVEPTPEMVEQGRQALGVYHTGTPRMIYAAMIYAAVIAAWNRRAQPAALPPKERLALNVRHPDCHKAADAFWSYWNENGETHKRGYYESTWGAINRALRTVGVVEHAYAPAAPADCGEYGHNPWGMTQDEVLIWAELGIKLSKKEAELRGSVRRMTNLLANNEWAEHLSADEDVSALEQQITRMLPSAPSVAPEPVAWTLQSELDAAQTTCSAHLWFTNPRNSAWTALFTREQIAAHPPRAPLTEEQRRDLVKECGLDWQRGYMPLFEGDPTNRYAVLVEAVEAAHGIGGK